MPPSILAFFNAKSNANDAVIPIQYIDIAYIYHHFVATTSETHPEEIGLLGAPRLAVLY